MKAGILVESIIGCWICIGGVDMPEPAPEAPPKRIEKEPAPVTKPSPRPATKPAPEPFTPGWPKTLPLPEPKAALLKGFQQ